MGRKKDPRNAVNEIREKIDTLNRQIEEVDSAKLPESDALANAQALMDRTADRALSKIRVYHMGQKNYSPANDCGLDSLTAFEVAVLTNPKGVRSLFERELREKYLTGDAEPIPEKDRPALREKLHKQLHALEVEEERIICEATEAGTTIYRRPDCNPKVVLEISEDRVPWDFRSEKFDRLVAEADAAQSLSRVRADSWLEAREVLAHEERRLEDLKTRNEPQAGIEYQERTVEVARENLKKATGHRQEALEDHNAKRAVVQTIEDFLRDNQQNRPVAAYGREDHEAAAMASRASKGTPGGYPFGKSRSEGI